MPTSIDRREVQRLVAEERAQLVVMLLAAEYEDEHPPGAINVPPFLSSSRAVLSSTNVERIHASNASTFLLIARAPA